jgi:hypothetical protein
MPDLKDIIKNKKKFVKNAYRPWDLTGSNPDLPLKTEVKTEKRELLVEYIKEDIDEDHPFDDIESTSLTKTINVQKTRDKKNVINTIEPLSINLKLTNLAGLQKKILSIIANTASKETLETGPIQTRIIAENINASIGSTKMSISRLVEKGFITREKGRTAKGGFLNLRIDQEAYEALLIMKKQGEPIIG